jgi:hypothetical protein
MTIWLESRRLLPILLLVLLIPGCGDDDSPTEPPSEEEPVKLMEIDFTIKRFECIFDGDGIEGAGEFKFTAYVDAFGKSWERQLSDGESATLNWSDRFQYGYVGDALDVTVGFTCSEIDTNILGDVYADDDMKGRSRSARETIDVGETITNYITLGNDNCKVRLHYTLEATLVVLK